MAKIVNIFSKGLNRDLSLSLNDNQHLYYSLDFDIVAQNGEELGIPHNTKGNSLQFTIPDLPPVYTMELDGTTGSVFITINGIGPLVISITSQTTIFDIYTEIINASGFSTAIANGEYGVFYNNSQVYIVGYSLNPNPLTTAGLDVVKIVDTVSNPSVIGWCLLDEDIIIVTTARNNTTTTPSGTDGQFWRISYDDATNTIPNLNGTALDPQYHLVKNDILNFSRGNEIIRELIGRVESSLKGNVYGTDDYNNPFALNIYNPQAAAIPPGLLYWKPEINTSTPLINGILNGGNTKVGTYQFAYQTYSADGAISNFSPTSMLIALNDEPFGTTDYYQFDGAAEGTIAGKSVRIKIPNIDTRYDFIKVAVIIYEVENVPQIFTFVDQPITAETMEFLYTGNENQVPLTTAQFLNPNISFDTVKTIAQKKNRLYPTNTTTVNFDLDWDARAYRFNALADGRIAELYSRNDAAGSPSTTINGAAPTYPTDDALDLVNPYNDESGQIFGLDPGGDYTTDWLANYQFKYKTDGITIGGEGPNVSYTFFVKTYEGDSDVTSIPTTSPFINVTSVNSGGTTQPIYNPSITNLQPTIDGWDSIKNPFYNMIFPSEARGEIYRFALTAYNTKGQQSFAKWIADIRIPEPWEDSDYDLSNLNGNALELRAIGINFTIDTSSLPSDITGFRILRVPRTDDDKTRLGIGLTTGLWSTNIQLASSPTGTFTPAWVLARKRRGGGLPRVNETLFDIDLNTDYNVAETDSLGIIKFPDFDFNKYQVGQASHIKKLHSYTITNSIIQGTPAAANIYWASNLNDVSVWMHGVLNKLDSVSSSSSDIVAIGSQTGIGIDGIVLGSTSGFVMGGIDFHNVVPYYSDFDAAGIPVPNGNPAADNEICGLGSKSLFCYFNGTTYGTTMTGTYDEYQLISLCRFNQGAYGGPWRSARYNNTYQAASDFIPKEAYNSTSQSIDVFGGDVYVNYYSTPLFFFHWGETYGVTEATPSGLASNYYPLAATQLALAISFPTESSINTDLRYGSYWNKNQLNQYQNSAGSAINDSPVFAKFLSDDFLFNDSFKQQNNIVPYFSKPFLIQNDEDNRVRTWVSEQKIDRELIDSWRLYPSSEYIDLEATYGESVKISNINEKLIVHQNRAVAQISSQELATVPNGQGQVLESGTGQLLSRYDYISKETGAFHQHAVITSPSSVYHFDVRLMKLYKLSNTLEALTDVEGLSAFFRNNVTGNIRTSDQVLLNKGVHGTFDTKYNKAYFTFEKTEPFIFSTSSITPEGNGIYTGFNTEIFEYYNQGQTIIINNTAYYIISLTKEQLILDNFVPGNSGSRTVNLSFTIAYNEFLQSFESFYSFTPTIYLGTGKRLFSANPYDTANSVYVHNEGNYGEFYDQEPSTSILQFISNYPDQSKIPVFRLDTMEFWTEVLDNQNDHITLESITGLIVENSYQTTSSSLNPLTLGPQGNFTAVDVEQTWRVNRFFDYTNPALSLKPYFRDKYTKTTVLYDNVNNRNLKLHSITSNITIS